MMEPKIKLRDGWEWARLLGGGWAAEGPDDACVDGGGDTLCCHGSSTGDYPADIVLAVIQANAPEVLREFVAGLATPAPDGECPRHYEICEHEVRIDAWQASADIDDHWQPTCEAAVAKLRGHRSRVAADCYPELVARIAELEAKEVERSLVFNTMWDADQRAIKQWQAANAGNDHVWPDRAALTTWLLERDAASSARIADLECEVTVARAMGGTDV